MNKLVDKETIDIINSIGKAATIELCAEECSELSQACLKMSRKLRGENPTPREYDEIKDNIIEEMADVMLCIDSVASCLDIKQEYVLEIINNKKNRWKKRVEEEK